MFQYIIKKIRYLWQNQNSNNEQVKRTQKTCRRLSKDLKKNVEYIRSSLGNSMDLIIRDFSLGSKLETESALIYLDGMADLNNLNNNIMKPLMNDKRIDSTALAGQELLQLIKKTILTVGYVKEVNVIEEVIKECLSGSIVFLINGASGALVMIGGGGESRSVEVPPTDSVVRGPREGFTERIITNITLIRRKLKNPNFTLETLILGEQSKTTVCIAYLKGVVNPKLISEINRRLNRIQTDVILESGYIEQYIEDAPLSLFATVGNSEKPDIVAAKMLEGRAAILIDGTPFVLTVPALFIESFQSPEDYYIRPFYASLVRIIRFIAFMIGILAPAIYVAISSFHQELIPTPLLFTMATAEEGIPFPSVMEALLMGLIFEILREAGIRLPRPVGQAVSIVGALVIGEAAVSAGLIGSPMVIVVALTAIASFTLPAQTDSEAILRILFVLFAGTLGVYGIMLVFLALLVHLASLRSFGTPYLSPLAPFSLRDMKDTFVRAPFWAMIFRPRAISWHDPQKQEFRLSPEYVSEKSKKTRK
ncbi:spore gernimation protein KA [Dehalobacter sp. MCB1]|uniref:spore germination protein n=1 Tax=unclassified Dehalobacter TaxID=2635733 RepID=UPI000E6C1153|nr:MULTISPECIES: spore germination protein [unclassified Dehalobacter]RJE47290.1 spore gernimation protein KA [Dehalobacter sp. MCB1]TCX54862.1 spore germination protein [Dehalobacter sp. 12DCB1]